MKEGKKKPIDIIIPAKDNWDYTKNCLSTLSKNTSYPYRVIFVDNGSNEETKKAEKDTLQSLFPKSHKFIGFPKNKGWIKAANKGIFESESEYIVLSNNDVRYGKDWLTPLVRAANQDEDLGIIASTAATSVQRWDIHCNRLGIHLPVSLSPENESALASWLQTNIPLAKSLVYVQHPVAFLCVLLRWKMVEELGFLDEDFEIGLGEDDLYCKKALYRGWKIGVCLHSYVWHHGRTTFSSEFPDEWRSMQQRNQILGRKKWENFLKENTSDTSNARMQIGEREKEEKKSTLGKDIEDLLAAAIYPPRRSSVENQILFFAGIVIATNAKLVFESGTGWGNSSRAFLIGLEKTDGFLYSCDPVKQFNFEAPRLRYFQCKSQELSKKWNGKMDGKFDIAFIDGSHERKDVEFDVQFSLKLLKNFGILIMHDVSTGQEMHRHVKQSWENFRKEGITFLSFPGLGLYQKNKLNI